jgi:uncharacterized protein (DUF2147 family)
MKHSSTLALAAFAAILILSPVLAAEPYGKWMRPSNGAQVNFFNCGGKLCGKVVSKGTSSAKVGTMIVGGAAKVVGADGLNLKGCALGVFCQGETWRRVQ